MAPRSRIFSDPLKPALLAALRAQLAPDEHLAWATSPEPAALESEASGSGKLDAVVILGGGYAFLGSCVMAVRSGQWFWLSVPLALLVLGLSAFFVVRWFKERARKAVEGTVYGVTTRRALILHTYPAVALQALQLDTIAEITIIDERDEVADLQLHAAAPSAGLVFRGVGEPKRARNQLLRVVRDPQGAAQQIIAAQAYSEQMRQLRVRR